MKRLTLQSLTALLVAVVISFSSCSKEGPAGPAGAQGPQGAQGSQGSKGDPGDPGTANVIYSQWDTYQFDSLFNDEDEFAGCQAVIPAEQLTADILNMGEMKVYVNVNEADDPVVYPLPYNDGSLFIDVIFATEEIYLFSNANLSAAPFRYILIPGGTAARKAGPLVDWNDYNAVKKYLNLKD